MSSKQDALAKLLLQLDGLESAVQDSTIEPSNKLALRMYILQCCFMILSICFWCNHFQYIIHTSVEMISSLHLIMFIRKGDHLTNFLDFQFLEIYLITLTSPTSIVLKNIYTIFISKIWIYITR